MAGTEERDFAERTLVGWHVLFGAMVVATAVLTALNGNAAFIVPLLLVLVAAYLLVWFPRQGCASLRRSVPFLVVACVVIALMTYRDLVPAAFFTAFVVTVIVFSMAIFVRE